MVERDMWFKDRIESLEGKVTALEIRSRSLRTALAAYRSALRSGEPESDQLRELGDAALTPSNEQSEVSIER